MRSSRRRLALVLVVLVVGGAVVAHHAMPEMSGMAAGVACLAVLAAAVTVAVAGIVRRAVWRPLLVAAPPAPVILAPLRIPARASPLYLSLLVLRR